MRLPAFILLQRVRTSAVKPETHDKTQRVANAPAKLRCYWTNVHQIFIRRRGLSAVLMHSSLLRFSHLLWNASAQNEGRKCQFRRFAPKIGNHSNVPWAIAKRRSDWSCPLMCTNPKTFREDRSGTFWDNWDLGKEDDERK